VRIYPWPYLQILDWPDKLGGANTLAYIVYSQQLIFKNFFDQFPSLSFFLSLSNKLCRFKLFTGKEWPSLQQIASKFSTKKVCNNESCYEKLAALNLHNQLDFGFGLSLSKIKGGSGYQYNKTFLFVNRSMQEISVSVWPRPHLIFAGKTRSLHLERCWPHTY
jgi:hypothetical protein